MKVTIPLIAAVSFALCNTASADLLNSKWKSSYSSGGGDSVTAGVQLKKNRRSPYGIGRYCTSHGNGTLYQVRRTVRGRSGSPQPRPGSPLPGPNSPMAGASASETVYIQGLWKFNNGTRGWFSWELYSTSAREIRFVGKWGYLKNNRPGPVRARWIGRSAPNGRNPCGSMGGNMGGNDCVCAGPCGCSNGPLPRPGFDNQDRNPQPYRGGSNNDWSNNWGSDSFGDGDGFNNNDTSDGYERGGQRGGNEPAIGDIPF